MAMGPHHWLLSPPTVHVHVAEIEADAGRHRHQADDGGDSRQHDRAEPRGGGLDDGVDGRHAFRPFDVDEVEQHDAVVDDDAREADARDARHEDVERHVEDDSAMSTPATLRTTVVMMMSGCIRLLNSATITSVTSSNATINALLRKSCVS